MKKLINYVAGVLIASAICSGAWAVVKVYVLEEKLKSQYDLIKETNTDVKEIRDLLVDHISK